MTRLVFLSITMMGFFMAYGCSSDSEDPSVKPDPPTQGENPDPDPEPVVQDSTTAIYRHFFFTGTHNSYSGNLGGMKREGIATQLERGLRFFEFDLFSFHTQKELQTTWPEQVDDFTVFDHMGEPYVLSYSKAGGSIKIYRLNNGSPEMVYGNTGEALDEVERKFSIVPFQTELYIFGYEPLDGDFIVYSFNGTSLAPVHSGNIGDANVALSTFIFNGNAYVGVYAKDDATYNIREISFDGGGIALGETLYEQSSIPTEEMLYPFEQDNSLYIFRHNANTVTNFKIESVDASGSTWTTSGSQTSTSSLLTGRVQASITNGKLFVNSYAANGDVKGSQLIMDNGKPNLVYEYNNESDMLSGAEAGMYPSENGYYLFLQKDASVQLMSIAVGNLVLGHDAPGDEVDLTVDNPSSIFLEDWITYIADWSNGNPDHEPLFIMTELKEYEQWMADAKWQNIIRLMQDKFGDKLRYHSSSGFHNEDILDQNKIVDGKTLYFMDENGSKEGGLLGKVVLYIQPNIKITQSEHTNNFQPFVTTDGMLQENFLQLKRYRENNKLVSPDWRKPGSYGNDIGAFIDAKDDSYISRIFHMQSSDGDGQYDNIRCTDVMFAVSDRPYEGLYVEYAEQQEVKNELEKVVGCD